MGVRELGIKGYRFFVGGNGVGRPAVPFERVTEKAEKVGRGGLGGNRFFHVPDRVARYFGLKRDHRQLALRVRGIRSVALYFHMARRFLQGWPGVIARAMATLEFLTTTARTWRVAPKIWFRHFISSKQLPFRSCKPIARFKL